MAEPLLNVVDEQNDEWFEAPNPYGAEGWMRLVGTALGIAANGISLYVLSSGLYARYQKRKQLKSMTPEQRAAQAHPLYEVLKETHEKIARIQQDVATLVDAEEGRRPPRVDVK